MSSRPKSSLTNSAHRHGVKLGRRITAASIFNCENINRFIESIVNILPYRGYSGSRFFTCELNNIRFLTKLCFYYKTSPEIYGRPNGKTIHQTDAEIRILDLFRQNLIDKNITPCILELIFSHECPTLEKIYPSPEECDFVAKDYRNTSPDSSVYDTLCEYKKMVEAGLAHDRAAFLVLERCDMTLEEYLRKSINTPVSMAIFKSLIFQIIYTFWAIRQIWPGFVHLDLHTENIMLKFDPRYRYSATDPRFVIFSVNGKQFTVPYFGIIAKLIDFGFSIIPEAGIISNIVDDKVMMFQRGGNDIIFLFHWIIQSFGSSAPEKRERVREFLSMLDPGENYIHAVELKNPDLPSFLDMLSGPGFEEYSAFVAPADRIYASFDEPAV